MKKDLTLTVMAMGLIDSCAWTRICGMKGDFDTVYSHKIPFSMKSMY